MAQILAISESITTFRQVEQKLGLSLSDDPDFFLEWSRDLPRLTAVERSRLDEVRKNYLYQISDGALLEETIKLVILSPLLELAGFYAAPYKFRAMGCSNRVQKDDFRPGDGTTADVSLYGSFAKARFAAVWHGC
jgi:hypothetical protein